MKNLDGQSFSLRQVVELTGVSEFTLRGWESRYQAFRPRRTGSGRRRYTKADILRARALLELTARGQRISSIATLPLSELEELIAEIGVIVGTPKGSLAIVEEHEALALGKHFDWVGVERVLNRAVKARTAKKFVFEYLLPLLNQIRTAVELGQLSIAQEHILSAYIKESLYTVRAAEMKATRGSSRLVFATPEGDFHEIGLLLASTLAVMSGVRGLYLGPNVPKADLCNACLRFDATHLVVASTISRAGGAKDDILKLVLFLRQQLGAKAAIWFAGPGAAELPPAGNGCVEVISTFLEFDERLRDLCKPSSQSRRKR